MCGIYGIAKSPTPYTSRQLKVVKKVLRDIAIDSETRGSHSSGIARVGANTRIYKSLLPSSKFVDTKEYNQSVKSLKDESYILLGHTRFATEGAIVKSNAHPFRVGDVVGAHNGCVYNIEEMQGKLDKQCPVDSQLIFKAINDKDNIQEAVKDFDSDFALSFVKKNPMVLHLCRETNRPLYIAYVPEYKTMFYASESAFIEDALFDSGIKNVDVYSLNKNTLYSFDVSKFDDIKMNVEKSLFDYTSRVYQWKLNTYPKSTPITYSWTSTFNQQELEFDDKDDYWQDEWKSQEAIELAEMTKTHPNSWFYEKKDDNWFHVNPDTGEISSEEAMFDRLWGDDTWIREESEIDNAS
tara:strand:- start:15665 stop:16723 length:1059 start_codon:yes stop_codon:yes gene_type:complete